MQPLNARTRRILFAVVTEYITTARPVGSRRLTRRYGIEVSPATIRTVLADLEEAGFVHQPHISAGRVPTDRGFRAFVDAMASASEVSEEHRIAIQSRLESLGPGDDVIQEAGTLLSALSGAAAVIALPGLADAMLDQFQFMPLREGQMLAVLVLRSGVIEHRVVQIDSLPAGAELQRLNNYLNEIAHGRSLREVRDALADRVATERGRYEALRRQAEQVVLATVHEAGDSGQVMVKGRERLFDQPEFVDTAKIRKYILAFEDRTRLLELLDSTLDVTGVGVAIGSEANQRDLADIGVISSRYLHDTAARGSVGVVGPARMDYTKVVPLVGFTAQVLGDLLERKRLSRS